MSSSNQLSEPTRVVPATAPWQPSTLVRGSLAEARELLGSLESVVVLTGAGMSTGSGIPDYRGPNSPRATPMLFQEFISDPVQRQRYWARAYLGWARMSPAQPNPGHLRLAEWQRDSYPCPMVGVITQNVDTLHDEAGQANLLHLHGRISDVVCLDCGHLSDRAELQHELAALNPDVVIGEDVGHAELRPDGDAQVEDWTRFVVPQCRRCAGVLKPDVVFFGETVPSERVVEATQWCERARAMVVLGSSLTVMSGLRFVRQMARAGKPVLIVNKGATRGDDLAAIRLDLDVVGFLNRVTL